MPTNSATTAAKSRSKSAPPTRTRAHKPSRALTLFFDTETVGSLENLYAKGPPYPPLNEQPYIIQLSFVLFDSKTYEMVDFYCAYIRIADLEMIDEVSFGFNGIKREMCEKHGIPMVDALKRFYLAYVRATTVVAHNISFDRKMILFERLRNDEWIVANYPAMRYLFKYEENPADLPVQPYCTMRESTAFCGLLNRIGKPKPPKLIELYRILFREDPPQPLHNAVIDSLVGLRCYLKRAEDKDIHNVKFRRMIECGFKIAELDPALLNANLVALA